MKLQLSVYNLLIYLSKQKDEAVAMKTKLKNKALNICVILSVQG